MNTIKTLLSLALYISSTSIAFSQTVDTSHTLISPIESRPEFPGGNSAMMEFITTNLQYPDEALKIRLKGYL